MFELGYNEINVYKDNFGESINDVAEAMATVNQNMSYLDDSALQRCTEYAYTLSDTFGYDVAESTRAADTLIKNYGVSAREAFNLITQGAQSGISGTSKPIPAGLQQSGICPWDYTIYPYWYSRWNGDSMQRRDYIV